MAQYLIRVEGALGFNGPFLDKGQGQDTFTDSLAGRGDGKGLSMERYTSAGVPDLKRRESAIS